MIIKYNDDTYSLRIDKISFKIQVQKAFSHLNNTYVYYLYPINRSSHWSLCRKLKIPSLIFATSLFNKRYREQGLSPMGLHIHSYLFLSPVFETKKGAIKFLYFLDSVYGNKCKNKDIFVNLNLRC